MALSAFSDKAHPPTEEDLRSTLGASHAAWARLKTLVSERIPPVNELWGFTGKSTGWGLRLRHGERVILYMTPGQGRFLVSFVLGEKAVTSAREADLPGWLLSAIDAAPRRAEGRGFRLQIEDAAQVPALAALAELKHRS